MLEFNDGTTDIAVLQIEFSHDETGVSVPPQQPIDFCDDAWKLLGPCDPDGSCPVLLQHFRRCSSRFACSFLSRSAADASIAASNREKASLVTAILPCAARDIHAEVMHGGRK